MSSYKDHMRMLGIAGVEVVHSYAEQASIRQSWHYGADRAATIKAGHDKDTNDDVAAWNGLGEKRRTA